MSVDWERNQCCFLALRWKVIGFCVPRVHCGLIQLFARGIEAQEGFPEQPTPSTQTVWSTVLISRTFRPDCIWVLLWSHIAGACTLVISLWLVVRLSSTGDVTVCCFLIFLSVLGSFHMFPSFTNKLWLAPGVPAKPRVYCRCDP